MEKLLIPQVPRHTSSVQDQWLDIETIARVELTSEDAAHPIEAALSLTPDSGQGWMAGQPGEQTIRFLFNQPLQIRRIHLQFRESEQERTQEFSLKWMPNGDSSFKEIVRQQYSFSPPHTSEESEEYQVALDGVAALELTINPDITGENARATLAQIRLA